VNLGELRTAVNRRSGVAYLTAALDDLINEALQQMALEQRWPWLSATLSFTTDGNTDGTYSLPWACRSLEALSVDGFDYPPFSQREADQWDALGERPRGAAAFGRTLTIRPVPPADLTAKVRYVRGEDELVNASEEPLLPEEYHRILVELVVSMIHDRTGDVARAAAAEKRYQTGLSRMVRSALHTQRVGSIQVRPGGGI
jgi:hypothetical protein